MARLYETQLSSVASSIPAQWLDEYGELDMSAVTKEAHRLRGETIVGLLASLSQSVKGLFHVGGHTAHS